MLFSRIDFSKTKQKNFNSNLESLHSQVYDISISIVLKGLALNSAYTKIFTREKNKVSLDSFIGFLQQPALTWSFYFRRENFAHIFCQHYLVLFPHS